MATRKTAAPAKKAAARKQTSGVKARADKAANPWAGHKLPDGFTAVTNGDYGSEWDYEQNPTLVGLVQGEVRTIEVKRGRVLENQRVVSVADEDTGEVFTVWDSASLRTWFDTITSGMRVAIVFNGYRDVGKGSPMKMFTGSIDPNHEAPVVARKTRRAK